MAQPAVAVAWEQFSQARFLSSGMPMTVQHLVQLPHDLPATMGGLAPAFQSSPKYSDGGFTAAARPAFLRFASPILLHPSFRP